MQRKSIASRSFWLILIAGMTTGMGNGSVFGAALMCMLGRAPFKSWGGEGLLAYTPSTFTGFIDWCMFIFGAMFCWTLVVAFKRHDALENRSA
jgi:hypothetical protein